MRRTMGWVVLLGGGATAGCLTGDSGGGPGFAISTPAIVVPPGGEFTSCHRFQTGNSATLALRQWEASLPEGAVSVMLYFTATGDSTACQFSDGNLSWIAYPSAASLHFPQDDGTGRPLAQLVPARQPGFVVVHLRNPTTDTLRVRVQITATGYPPSTAVTRADPLATWATNLNIGPGAATSEIRGCNAPTDATFFAFTTHTFHLSTHSYIRDGGTVVFQGDDHADPGARIVSAPPFVTFATGVFTYQCDYLNTTNNTFNAGDSPTTSEQCVALAWHFPSTGPRICLGNLLL